MMERRSDQPGGNLPPIPAAANPLPPVQRIRFLTALFVALCAPVHTVSAGEIPTASANAELVAFAGALEYAARPQLSLDAVDTGEATLRSRSLTYIAREFGRMVVRDLHNNMRKESDQPRMPSTRARINSRYDLRVSDDELVVRMKYRF